MKAILEFDLPEDKCEFAIASNAMSWALTVWDLDQYLRNLIKHFDAPEEVVDIREKLSAILEERTLSLDEIE